MRPFVCVRKGYAKNTLNIQYIYIYIYIYTRVNPSISMLGATWNIVKRSRVHWIRIMFSIVASNNVEYSEEQQSSVEEHIDFEL